MIDICRLNILLNRQKQNKVTNDQSRLNYEEQNQYKIRIQFFNQSNTIEKDFFIDIEDVNEPPYDLQCSNSSGFCSALDEDLHQTLTFQIKILSNFEYEIICTDNGQPPLSVSTKLQILPDDQTLIFVPVYSLIIVDNIDNNLNNHRKEQTTQNNIVVLYSNDGDKTGRQRRQANSPPQDIYFDRSYLNISENSQNIDIAHVYVTDPDNDNYNCSVYTHNSPIGYQPFEIKNEILQTSSAVNDNNYDIDYETIPIYDITVTCEDPIHRFTIAKDFTIVVEDVNEVPVELRLIPNLLPENSLSEYVIGRFHTVDPDRYPINQTFDYTITNNPKQMFRIDNDQLILITENQVEKCLSEPDLCPHDYEQINVLYLLIRVTDHGSPPASQRFWIELKITDENDPPVNLQLDRNSVSENSPVGSLIGSFSVQDEDVYQTHTFSLLSEQSSTTNQSLFYIEFNNLHLARIPDYEQENFVLITVQAIDNGTIPKNTTNEFLIEIVDVDEFPSTYQFLSTINENLSNETIEDLISGKQPVRINYLPDNHYTKPILGRIVFLFEDHNRELNLNGGNDLIFSKPICEIFIENPYRLLCTSMVYIENVRENFDDDGYVITTTLFLTSNGQTKAFPRKLCLKFENITLIIDDEPVESIIISNSNASGYDIGLIYALDFSTNPENVYKVTLNPNTSYPLEIIDLISLKIRDDVNFYSLNSSAIYNISVFVQQENRTIEKYLIVYVKDQLDFNLTLSNSQILENSRLNTLVGIFTFDDRSENYILNLIDNANGIFKLNEGNLLLIAAKYDERCHLNNSCLLNYENNRFINITVAVRDAFTNQTIRLITYSIEIVDENEPPFNITLTNEKILENLTIGSVVSLINTNDEDYNQTITYTIDNPTFTIMNNQLILAEQLNYYNKPLIPLIIRATDDGQPPLFTEKYFEIKLIAINRAPYEVLSDPFIIYLSSNRDPLSVYLGHIDVVDPDVQEKFQVTFDYPSFRAISPALPSVSIVADDTHALYAQIYNISIIDINPSIFTNQSEYIINATANITDSANHSISHEITVRYIQKQSFNETNNSTVISLTTPSGSFSQALHIRIYETTPAYTPIIRALVSSSNNTIPVCLATDDKNIPFLINNTRTIFMVYLPDNYTLNSTNRPEIFLHVQCTIINGTYVSQEIVIDVLPAPPTVQINFNQTQPFYTNNNYTILGSFASVELTTTPTNRTYQLSLVNYKDIFQLLPNNSLIQIDRYPSEFFEMLDPHINLTIQSIETTLNVPTRIIQRTFSIPIIINTNKPFLTFNQTSISNDTNPNTTIGYITIHNSTEIYQLILINTYDDGLQLDQNTNSIILKKSLNQFSFNETTKQIIIEIELKNTNNQTILLTKFPLTITYSNLSNPCSTKDCGNGTCISLDQGLSYCLCTSGYTGIDCRTIDPCVYNPCLNNGICQQRKSTSDFQCQCLPNYSGSICEIFIDICQLNRSLCLITEICIPLKNNLTTFYQCVSKNQTQYFIFDYLKNIEELDVMNDENLQIILTDFIRKNLIDINNLVLLDRQILGPEVYRRAALISIAISSENQTLNDSLARFCQNQSFIFDSLSRQVCSGYNQSNYLKTYFQTRSNDCPNCTFAQSVDKYYWFDELLPYLPVWIILIVGSILLTLIPLIPYNRNIPKKVAVPLMKAKLRPEEETSPSDIQSLPKAIDFPSFSLSYRQRNDSGYESNDDDNDKTNNYLNKIIENYSSDLFVYPILNNKKTSSDLQQYGKTIDDVMPSELFSTERVQQRNSSNIPSRTNQRSLSMAQLKTRRRSSIANSQTLKPIIQRRSTLFDSSISRLIQFSGIPRLNSVDDDTYISNTFQNENTSKFVIGTLWNTFALVNNLFLQRPRKRRNALIEENIQAEELARLQQIYSLAENEQSITTDHLQSIINDIDSDLNVNHLQTIVSDINSLNNKQTRCTCYGNHHIPSCQFYDHSLPFIKNYINRTIQLENSYLDLQKISRPIYQDATTQSDFDRSKRIFTTNVSTQSSPIQTFRQTHSNVSTQSSPIQTFRQTHSNVSTQCSPIVQQQTSSIQSNKHSYMNISTQTIEKTNLNDLSTHINTSTQFSPIENENISKRNIPEQETKILSSISTKDNDIYDRRNSVRNELKQVFNSSQINKSSSPLPNHTVKSLVSLFETSLPVRKLNYITPLKSIKTDRQTTTGPESTALNLSTTETIEKYANDVASNILDNAVLTATITTIQNNEQLKKRFSFYKNAGGHGKNLLFQSNTFLPTPETTNQDIQQNIRVESQVSSVFLNDPNPLHTYTTVHHPDNESQHTLIVGHYVDGNESDRSKIKQNSHLNIEYSSSNDEDDNYEEEGEEENINHQQFLSNSQLFSAQELYIRPWLVRRATAPDIHCLDNDIADTRVEIFPSASSSSSQTYFHIFPSHYHHVDLYTRLTCLITIVFYLDYIHDQYSNKILYDQIEQIEHQLIDSSSPQSIVHSNTFQTINPDGSKRYRTGFIVDINSSNETNQYRQILAQQIQWKHVKILVRRFRKKHRYYKQLLKNDTKISSIQKNIHDYLKYFDSTSKRRIKKYAKHYAQKL